MLRSAVLRTLPQVEANLMRVNPHAIGVIGNQVGFAGEAWHPETVICIRRQERDRYWRHVIAVTHWDVQFVCSHDSECRVAVLPPELVCDSDYLDRMARSRIPLRAGNYSRRCHEQSEDDQKNGSCHRQYKQR